MGEIMMQQKVLPKSTGGGAGKLIEGNEINDSRCPLWLAGPLVNCFILGAHYLPQHFGKRKGKE